MLWLQQYATNGTLLFHMNAKLISRGSKSLREPVTALLVGDQGLVCAVQNRIVLLGLNALRPTATWAVTARSSAFITHLKWWREDTVVVLTSKSVLMDFSADGQITFPLKSAEYVGLPTILGHKEKDSTAAR